MTERNDLPKAYDAGAVEDQIYAAWEASGAFNPDELPKRNQEGEPYGIVMPPPNRTGRLHMGHATMLAIQDLLIRFERMRGKKALWVPGTDHAAIATNVKVEQLLREQGMEDPRKELGREAFVKKVEEYVEESGKVIDNQVRKMGSSCDWSRERYTLDAERNAAVYEVFQMMYEDGLIERGNRIVNWDPKTQTVISDDEIEWVDETVPFYYLQYGPFVIGTARPETKFGDKYVVMHPDDERYAAYHDGQEIEVEWINGTITATVIKDAVIDREFGTGVMTITPWHDVVDYEIAERHNLKAEQIIDLHGKLMAVAGDFAGMDIVEARKKMIGTLKEKGLLVRVDEKYAHRVATSQRGGGTIEPQILRQWFVRVNKPFTLRQDTLGKWKKGDSVTLKELMLEAVTSGQTKIVPERFEKIYFNWINNLRDWCISRQVWFGHRVPVWYRGDDVNVSDTSPGKGWEQDPDTLDTWFSSGLWTFSALGWPDKKEWKALRAYHPTAVLETGYDILFFWVARMVLMTTYVLGEVPFKDVYLHGLIRDEQGRKMSKSLGNILDPLDLIPKYGTDAVRLSLVIGSTPGQDVKLSEQKIEGYRNFTNKLWNISRFVLSVISTRSDEEKSTEISRSARNDNGKTRNDKNTLADTWILSRLADVAASVTHKLETYQFSAAGEELRDFTWNDLADWYLEIAKVEGGKSDILLALLQSVLKLWHPFMPFVTEHIWSVAGFEGALIVAEWPERLPLTKGEHEGVASFEHLRSLVTDMRRLRADQRIEAPKKVTFAVAGAEEMLELAGDNLAWIKRLTNAADVNAVEAIPEGWPVVASAGVTIGLDVSGAVDVEQERVKLEKELASLSAYIGATHAKLSDAEFSKKAPEAVVRAMADKLAEAREKHAALVERLRQL